MTAQGAAVRLSQPQVVGAASLLRPSALFLLWALLTLVALWARPLVPVDETRYATVAWEMWLSSDWLLPHLNGTAYADKPPLLFWLINLAWALAGPSEWSARFVGAAATLLDLWLLHRLERLLWPEGSAKASLSPWLFYGCFFVASFSTFLMFDMVLTAAVLLALIGLVRASRHGGFANWALYAIGIGIGALTKGPVILVYLLPVALLGPWWLAASPAGGWRRWYGPFALAVLAGAVLALCWAVPAGRRGGPGYNEMILWGQTAGRMVSAFQHARPWWWYLPVLPVILLPWSLWPPIWRALAAARKDAGAAERFCMAWFLPGLVAFSAISGKQVHYLIPLLPALALLAARALQRLPERTAGAGSLALVLAPWICLGLAISLASPLAALQGLPSWWSRLSPAWGVALAAVALAWWPVLRSPPAHRRLATLTVLLAALMHAGPVHDAVYPAFDAGPLAKSIAALQDGGKMVVYPGKYHGDFQFAGRLRQPLAQFWPGTEIAFANAHPQAVLILNHRLLNDEQRAAAILALPYRSGETALWHAATLIAHPEYAAGALPGTGSLRDGPD